MSGPFTEDPTWPVLPYPGDAAVCLVCPWADSSSSFGDRAQEHARCFGHPCVIGPDPVKTFTPDDPDGLPGISFGGRSRPGGAEDS